MEECCIVHLQLIDGLHLSFVEPFDALTVLPKAELHFIVLGHDIGAQPVLLALVPVALVAALVGPRVDAESVLLIVLVLALVHPAIVPNVNAHAFHVIVQPFALVASAIEPRVDTDAGNLVLSPVAGVHGSIVPLVAADAVLAAEGVVALVLGLVRPGLNAVAVLQVVLPEALVLCPIHVLVDATAIGLVVGPVAVVDVAIDMDESAFAVGPILTPLTTVFGPVRPRLLTKSITEATLPLACVNSARLESVRRSLLALLIRIVDIFGDSFARLLLSEILAASHLLGFEERDQLACPVSSVPGLQLDNEFHVRYQKFVVVLVVRDATATGTIQAAGPFVSAPIQALKLRRLAVHVEFCMLAILGHAVATISRTISHFVSSSIFQIVYFSNILSIQELIQ